MRRAYGLFKIKVWNSKYNSWYNWVEACWVRSSMAFVFSKYSCISWLRIHFAIVPLLKSVLSDLVLQSTGRIPCFSSQWWTDHFLWIFRLIFDCEVGCNCSCFWYYPSCIYHAYGRVTSGVCSNFGYDRYMIAEFHSRSSRFKLPAQSFTIRRLWAILI